MENHEIDEFIANLPDISFDINYLEPGHVMLPCKECGKESTVLVFLYGKTGPRETYCDEHRPNN